MQQMKQSTAWSGPILTLVLACSGEGGGATYEEVDARQGLPSGDPGVAEGSDVSQRPSISDDALGGSQGVPADGQRPISDEQHTSDADDTSQPSGGGLPPEFFEGLDTSGLEQYGVTEDQVVAAVQRCAIGCGAATECDATCIGYCAGLTVINCEQHLGEIAGCCSADPSGDRCRDRFEVAIRDCAPELAGAADLDFGAP
jgi:hypothetical protein